MAVPNRKRSRTRTRTARGPKIIAFRHKIINSLPKIICQNCKQIKILHRVCLNCFDTNFNGGNKQKKSYWQK